MYQFRNSNSGNGAFPVCIVLLIAMLCLKGNAQAGARKKVLFIGNSYTYVNNLPQLVAQVAASMGDTLIFDSETSGGATFYAHTLSIPTKNKILQGDWDYVVLQEQSQAPSLPTSQVQLGVFPYARYLDSLVHASDSCSTTLFYMTWGRKNGDAVNCAAYPSWPGVCTYEGMDSLLRLRYRMMADSNDAELSPVGAVWHYIRQHYPSIELYDPDESHPSAAGSYAAACSFYAAIFRRDPALASYNATLTPSSAANIRAAAKAVVFDSLLYWHIGEYDPSAQFTYAIGAGNQVSFSNSSLHAGSYNWSFGDGQVSQLSNPSHTYPGPGSYQVRLIASNCGKSDTLQIPLNLYPAGVMQLHQENGDFRHSYSAAGSKLMLHSPDFLTESYMINILTSAGQLVQQRRNTAAGLQEIDLSALSSGVYILTVTQAARTLYRTRLLKD